MLLLWQVATIFSSAKTAPLQASFPQVSPLHCITSLPKHHTVMDPFSERLQRLERAAKEIFEDTGIRIHPWDTVFSENLAYVAINIYHLIGGYINTLLGDINPECWTRSTLQSLQTLLLHATSHIDNPNQRKERLRQIKTYLVTCAFADAWRGMKPTLYPRHLQNARLFFSISHHQDPADANITDESDNSEANPSIPTPGRPRTNSVARKHPATESFLETSPKQPRRQEIAVSVTTGDNTEVLSLPIQVYNTDFSSSAPLITT